MFSADGTTVTVHLFGRSLLYAPNLTASGLPSNIVATAGSVVLTSNLSDPTGAFASLLGPS